MALRRITKELADFENDPPRGLSGGPTNDDLFHWRVTCICDKVDNSLHGGSFIVEVEFPADYPFKPPSLRMATKIYHPQLWKTDDWRAFCISVFNNWSPALTISKILMTVSAMINEPFSSYQECRCCGGTIDEEDAKAHRTQENPTGAMALYFNDRHLYNKTAKQWCIQYAGGISTPPPPQSVQRNDDQKDNHVVDVDICIRLLTEWRLFEYKEVLMDERGYDDVEDWEHITEEQLMEDMRFKQGHAKRFVRKMKRYLESTQVLNNDEAKPVVNNDVTSDVSRETEEKLGALNAMGFQSRTLNLAVLNQHKGDVNKAIGSLIQFYN